MRWRAQCEWALWLHLLKCLTTVARSVNFCIYVRNDNKMMRNYLCISVYSFTYNLAILTQPYDSRMRIHALIKRSLTTHWLHFVASRTAKIGSRWIPVLIPVYRYWFFSNTEIPVLGNRAGIAGSTRDLTTPLSGMPYHPGLAIATDNLPTKFEVCISIHYEDMKDDTKCRKWGGLELASLKITGNSTNR